MSPSSPDVDGSAVWPVVALVGGAAVVGAILVATAALLASYDRPHHAAETILDWLV